MFGLFLYFCLLQIVFQWTSLYMPHCESLGRFSRTGFPNIFICQNKTEKDFSMAHCGKQMRGKWQGLWLTQPSCHPEGWRSHYLSTPVTSCHITPVEKFCSMAWSLKLCNVYVNHLMIKVKWKFWFCRSGVEPEVLFLTNF